MKHLYFVICLLCITFSYGQVSSKKGGIEGFKLYPNPVTNGKVFISTLNNDPKQVFIYDIFGTAVLNTALLGKELNVSNLDAGVYVIRVMEKDKVATRKLIIK